MLSSGRRQLSHRLFKSKTLFTSKSRSFSISTSSPSLFTWQPPTEADEKHYPAEDVFRAGMRHHHICNTAFPIAHNTTIRPYRVKRLRDQHDIQATYYGAYGSLPEMMLYAHVPFCETRCQFCEYTVVNPKQGRNVDIQTNYFSALYTELDMYANLLNTKEKKLVGFDIGGGTPSMAKIEHIQQLMERVESKFQTNWDTTEVSIETTPKIAAAQPEKMKAYYDMGIRRISMGLQTTDFRQAKEMNRDDANASAGYIYKAVTNVRNAGFKSFNIDLMYGFPIRASRTDDPWLKTVQDTIDLQPEHITLYRMRYKGTQMAHLADRVNLDQVNRQEGQARQLLNQSGYIGLTGKNTFSRVQGNSGCSDYLDKRVRKAVPYIGIGLGAQSFSHYTLSYNLGAVTKKLQQYTRSVELNRIPVQDLYHLSREAAIAKMASVSFYYGGIDLIAFKDCFKISLDELFPNEFKFVVDHGLMIHDTKEQRLQMTKLGKQCFGGVVALFYSSAVKNHILNLQGGEQFLVDPVKALKEGESPFQPIPDTTTSVRRRIIPTVPSQPTPSVPSQPTQSVPLTTSILTSQQIQQPINQIRRSFSSLARIDTSKPYEFGNILFSGPCNQKCPFCIGHQLLKTPNNLRKETLESLDEFISVMKQSKTSKIILTGTRTDPQLYKYEEKLLNHLRSELPNIHISLHTNGLLAIPKIKTFRMYDSCTISINSFNPRTYSKLHGVKQMPNLKNILQQASNVPIKLSCVLTEDNIHQVEEYLQIAKELGIKRIALRHLYGDDRRWPIKAFENKIPIKYHQSNPVYDFDGLQVTHWIFDKTSGRSLNLFSDGTLSPEYLLTKAPNQSIA
jgi:oxygen-independent coproporphyrinogen-3 oxidase